HNDCMHVFVQDDVNVDYQVSLHSSINRRNDLIGMWSMILDGAEIGENAFFGAGSLVPQGKTIPPNTIAFGRPAKVIRELTDEDYAEMEKLRKGYVENGQFYKGYEDLCHTWTDYNKPLK